MCYLVFIINLPMKFNSMDEWMVITYIINIITRNLLVTQKKPILVSTVRINKLLFNSMQ